MLSHGEALKRILLHTQTLGAVSVGLSKSLGCVLAKAVKAKVSLPHFDNSAVDGYAIRWKSEKQREFKFKGEIPAGHTDKKSLKPGEAMAIFTGAPTPTGADAVVMQEYAERRNGSVLIQKSSDRLENIRFKGEDFKKGDDLIPRGTCLSPQHLALMAALGNDKTSVIRSPKVAILSTGSEIIPPGQRLKPGQIYDSNTPMLEALIRKIGGEPVLLPKAYDTLAKIRRTIRKGLDQDVLIVCGGVSVGKYDFVKEALRLEGVSEIFWKIDIKPGKPVYFGKKSKTLVFGLPGNPVSVFVTFEEFVKPALMKMMAKRSEDLWIEGVLTQPFKNGSRPNFVRAHCKKTRNQYEVTPLERQGSHQIGSLVQANALLKVDAGRHLKMKERVRVKRISEGRL